MQAVDPPFEIQVFDMVLRILLRIGDAEDVPRVNSRNQGCSRHFTRDTLETDFE